MTTRFEKIKEIPNDQYSCTYTNCELIPEIKGIDYNNAIIVIRCPKHGEIKLQIDDYFHSELPNLYYSCICNYSKLEQSKHLKDNIIFDRCLDCENEKIFCHICKKEHGHHKKFLKVNETNYICHKHLKQYDKYCLKCWKHFCDDEECKCKHKQVKKIEKAYKDDIEIIKNQRNKLLKKKELYDYLIKLLDTILETNEKHPSNYYNSINIRNIANIKDDKEIFKEISNEKLDNYIIKLKNYKDRILEYINGILNLKIDGKEKILNLQNKNIDDNLLKLITMVEFNNLEEMNLKNNNIKDTSLLANLNAKNLKKIDLSFNKINDIKSLKEIIKEKIFSLLEYINLEYNQLTNKDLEEIKELINKDDYIRECKMNYILKKSENKVRLFGENFVKRNKNNCKMQIENDNERIAIKEILNYKDIREDILKKGSINIKLLMNKKIEDMSGLFFECNRLKKIDDIFYLNSSDIKEIKDMFYGCSSLESLPDSVRIWDTLDIKDMSGLFFGCLSLKSLPDIGIWKTDQLTDVTSMFRGCSHLESLPDLSNWDTSNVTTMRCMFYECSSLKNIPDLSKWNVSKVTDMGYMFNKCTSLNSISDLSKWDTSKVTSMKCMFKGCSSLSSKPIVPYNKDNSTDVSEMFDS